MYAPVSWCVGKSEEETAHSESNPVQPLSRCGHLWHKQALPISLYRYDHISLYVWSLQCFFGKKRKNMLTFTCSNSRQDSAKLYMCCSNMFCKSCHVPEEQLCLAVILNTKINNELENCCLIFESQSVVTFSMLMT